jgi:hypothetical protein
MDIDQFATPLPDDDGIIVHPTTSNAPQGSTHGPTDQVSSFSPDLNESTVISTTVPTTAAQRRATRHTRVLPLDRNTTLHNADLAA